MGDLGESWSAASSCSSLSSSSWSESLYSPNLLPFCIDMERLFMAEQRALEIICAIQPTLKSDRSRKEIIDYVQKLIKDQCGAEVFSFGSFPLKTYLPDGDIDLTVLSNLEMEEELANNICTILEEEEQNSDFQVKHINYISAQVKVIKCDIRSIAVDISFNQMEGLCTLCFLEQVDQLIGKDHLFKRSIILIKAWCYYEGRILGAHSGLFSTYAIEVLVLYVINLFHPTLSGPLAVLYKFLDYYGKFDWDNYCVSVNGPVPISSLPNILVAAVQNDGAETLLSQEFLERCKKIYSIPIKAVEANNEGFLQKHLNIVDPLKENNNLGRSVSKGNSNRIRSALFHGARKLRKVLMLPDGSMGSGIEKFFANTLDRNGKGQRHDVDTPVAVFGTGRAEATELTGNYSNYYNSLVCGQLCHNYTLPELTQFSPQTLASQIQNTNPWYMVRQSMIGNQNDFFQWYMDFFVLGIPFPHPNNSQLAHPYFGFLNPGISRGTGTYIPHTNFIPHRDRHEFLRTRSRARLTYRPLLRSPDQTDRTTEDSPETSNVGSSNSISFSLDEFPSLITAKEPSSEVNQPDQPTLKNVRVDFGNMKFETSEVLSSLSGQPSTLMKPVGSASSSASGSKTGEEKYMKP